MFHQYHKENEPRNNPIKETSFALLCKQLNDRITSRNPPITVS